MVLHLSTFHLEGGAGVAATRLHRALLKNGVDSKMLVHANLTAEAGVAALAETKWEKKKAFARFAGERLFFLPNERGSSVRFAFSPAGVGADISSHPWVLEADVIHLHWINFGFLSMNSLEKLFSLGKPIVWTLHDMWTFTGGCHYSRGCDHYLSHCQYCPYLHKPDEYDISFSQFEQKLNIYKKTDMFLISPSRWLDGIVKQAVLTKHMASASIPNCVDTLLFKPLDKVEIRKKSGLPLNKKLILFAGANTQDPRKGFAYFKEAIRQLNESGSDCEVLIFGKSNPDSFGSFPVPVHYLGTITKPEDMVDAYNAADLIVVPSLEDNLPNTIMEALACGTPVAGFKTGGIPEMIDHQLNGYLSEIRSAESLNEGIQWILENNKDGKLSDYARKKVLDLYAEEVVAYQYSQIYKSLISDPL